MEFYLPLGYSKQKRAYKEYAQENLNLAVSKNEYGEVAREVREQIVADTEKRNKLILSANRLLSVSVFRLVVLPLLYLIFGLIVESSSYVVEYGRVFFIAGIIAALGIVKFVCLKYLTANINMVSVRNIVNSKVSLGDKEIVYSYSTIDPKRTDGKRNKRNNYFVKRMRYSDITSIAYNERKNCYLLKGTYEITKYTDYRIGQASPIFKNETILMNPMVIFDVYHDRDMFIELSKKVGKPIVPDSTEEKTKIGRRLSVAVFGFITVLDCLVWLGILVYIALIFVGL